MSAEDLLSKAIELHRSGRLAEAERAYRLILDGDPENAEALQLLGVIANQAGKPEASAELIGKALEIDPGHADAHCNLGSALMEMNDLDGAAASFSRALEIDSNIPEAHNNLGNIWRKRGNLEEAAKSYRIAIRIAPGLAQTHSNLGIVLHVLGRFAEAEASYRRALAIDPGNAEAHANLATTLLHIGRLEEGWAENEWRWRKKTFTSPPRSFPQPRWDGSTLDGKTLLLHAEQGFGDTLQFVRYASLAAEMGGRIVVECQPQMKRLLDGGVWELVAQGESLPPFDVHTPLLSLPLIFKTTLDTIPLAAGYLTADASLAESWRQRLPDRQGLTVGLVWQGNKAQRKDRTRSIPLALLEPLLDATSSRFVSLQKGDGEEQIKDTDFAGRIFDPAPDIADFADTAAIIHNLDLVICVDTAVAHLAGALGKPVWVLLEHVPDWRYMQDRADSPWYASMRLFRQKTPDDWPVVVTDAAQALKDRDRKTDR